MFYSVFIICIFHFTDLRMWFLKETHEGENKTLPNACREFKVPSNLSLDTVLFFDCLWLKSRDTEGSVYKFQYEVLASPGLPSLHTFLFKHPFSSQMSKLVFMWHPLFLCLLLSYIQGRFDKTMKKKMILTKIILTFAYAVRFNIYQFFYRRARNW